MLKGDLKIQSVEEYEKKKSLHMEKSREVRQSAVLKRDWKWREGHLHFFLFSTKKGNQ